MKKYKLLKDLPGIKAGSIIENDHAYFDFGFCDVRHFRFNNYPDWFEEIPTKWKPKEGQEYWYVSSDGNVSLMRWRDNALCNFYFEFGNCFPTKQAASEMRDKIKELLEGEE